MDIPKQTEDDAYHYGPVYSWYVVAVLLVMMLFSWLDRKIIVLLIDPIKHDLGISEVQMGLLAGFAFALVYSICLFPLGWAADRFSRRTIILCGVAFWGLATASCGLARNYFQLFLGRIAVGAGEATLAPSGYSILADVFPPKRLAFASAVMSSGVAIGMGLSFVLGGAIASFVSHGEVTHLPLIGEVRSWQVAFIAVGLPGPFLALLMLTIKEPVRINSIKRKAAASLSDRGKFFTYLRPRWAFYASTIGACATMSIGFSAINTWGPPYLSRVFHWSASQIGSTFGLILAISAVLAFLFGGVAADYLHKRGIHAAHLRMYMVVALIALPVALLSILSNDPWLFLTGIFFWQFLIGGTSPVVITALQLATPNEFRGRIIALLLVTSSVIGQGLGPFFVAALTQYFFNDDSLVGWSLAITVVIIYPLAALLFWIAGRCVPKVERHEL